MKETEICNTFLKSIIFEKNEYSEIFIWTKNQELKVFDVEFFLKKTTSIKETILLRRSQDRNLIYSLFNVLFEFQKLFPL